LRPFRASPGTRAVAVVLVSLLLSVGCLPQDRAVWVGMAPPRLDGERLAGASPREAKAGDNPAGETRAADIPEEDVRGEPVPWLPRPPGSVRVGYSEKEADGLTLVRASYLTTEKADAVLGFYRGLFAAEGWQVANVEYAGGGWHFLVLRGDLEAKVKVRERDGGSEAGIELSGPAGGGQGAWASAGGSKR
jgi:hypothetical protein